MVIARPGVIVNLCQSAGESIRQPNVPSVWFAATEEGTRVNNSENSVCIEAATQSAYSNSSYYLDWMGNSPVASSDMIFEYPSDVHLDLMKPQNHFQNAKPLHIATDSLIALRIGSPLPFAEVFDMRRTTKQVLDRALSLPSLR